MIGHKVSLKDRLLREMEKYFGIDEKRINHAKKVMGYAEELLKSEKADKEIVIPASILHDIGIKVAEKKYNSAAGCYQEMEGPEIARGILLKEGLGKEEIDEICEIIRHHHSPGKIDTLNFKVLYDADWLANLKDEFNVEDKEKLDIIIADVFLTNSGKQLARQIYLAGPKNNN